MAMYNKKKGNRAQSLNPHTWHPQTPRNIERFRTWCITSIITSQCIRNSMAWTPKNKPTNKNIDVTHYWFWIHKIYGNISSHEYKSPFTRFTSHILFLFKQQETLCILFHFVSSSPLTCGWWSTVLCSDRPSCVHILLIRVEHILQEGRLQEVIFVELLLQRFIGQILIILLCHL